MKQAPNYNLGTFENEMSSSPKGIHTLEPEIKQNNNVFAEDDQVNLDRDDMLLKEQNEVDSDNEVEKYFTFEEKKDVEIENGPNDKNGQAKSEVLQSRNFFDSIQQINAQFKAM